MSARIVPLSVLTFVLLTIFCAVVATAQQPVLPAVTPEAAIAAGVAALPQPQAPFSLTPEEQAIVDRVLIDWQKMSANVNTFQCDFTRWDYDGVFGNGKDPKRVINGTLRYAAPDRGFYDLDDHSEKWVCTGDAIFEFKSDLKQVREYPLPPEMRGKAISDGPLPFVFGVEAEKMKARYWLRITTPPERQGNQVWIEAYPKHAKDSANFTKVDVILTFDHDNGTIKKLEPFGINLVLPNGKDRTAYAFREMKTNNVIDNFENFLKIFVRPSTPFGWQHQVVDDTVPTGPETPPGAQPGAGIGLVPNPNLPR